MSNDIDLLQNGLCDLEIGNDIAALRVDIMNGDSDEESTESGFSEQGDATASSQTSTGSASSAMSESSGTGSIATTIGSVCTNDSLGTIIDTSETLSPNGHLPGQGQIGSQGQANGRVPESVRL